MPLMYGSYSRTPVNKSDMPQSELDIETKIRSNPFPWPGQFSPQLVQSLLVKYGSSDSVVLDPFMGSGTVLLEAGRLGMPVLGSEINPAAVVMARTYQFANVLPEERERSVAWISAWLHENLPEPLRVFETSDILKHKLVSLAKGADGSLHLLAELLVVMSDFYKPCLSLDRILKVWERLSSIVLKLPYSPQPVQVFNSDVRELPLADSSVNLVLTSPPYINVFNYHQRFRASMEALQWDMLRVAQSEFGANRKHRKNRFLTVVQFCLDIAQALKELGRVCTLDARLIFVVGRESTVCGTRFFNGEIVSNVAQQVLGYDLTLRQERAFVNRYGKRIFEDVLHFSHPGHPPMLELKEAREVARKTLEVAYPTVPQKASDDVKSALANIEYVVPSPLFTGRRTLTVS